MASHTIFNEISCISFSISCKLDVHAPYADILEMPTFDFLKY